MKHDDDGNYDKLQIRGSLMMNIMMTVMILSNNYDCDDGAQLSSSSSQVLFAGHDKQVFANPTHNSNA